MCNLDCDNNYGHYVGVSFRKELAHWWFAKCVTMGKKATAKEPEEGSRSPPKPVKTAEPQAGGSGMQVPTVPAHSDSMLKALSSIGVILKDGFESVRNKVGEVNTNMISLDVNMSKRFDALEADADSDSDGNDQHDEAGEAQSGQNKGQDNNVLSEGEIEEPISEVLAETLEVIESDTSVGPPVGSQVADFVKKAFAKPLKSELATKLSNNFKVPQNIDCLGVARMNEPIYVKVCATVKNKDRAIQDIQSVFMKSVIGLVKIADTLSAHEKEAQWVKDTMKIASEAITLSAFAQSEWMKQRREDVKPSLPDDFKRLSSVEVPLTAKNLFGDDLEGSIKSVESVNKIAKRMEVKKPKPQTQQNKSSKWANKKRKRNNNNNNNNNSYEGDDAKKFKKGKKDFQKKGSKY